MIVDDQRATRMGLSLIINRADDLQVTAEAVHGQDALDQLAVLLEERRPLPDVVLMDVRMPVLNGIDATARICQLYPSIRVLVLTTYDQDEFAFGALSAGASGFLLKDTRPAELAEAIRTVASGEAVVSPRITQRMLEMFAASLPSSDAPAQPSSDPRIDSLTPREKEILVLMSQGMSNAEIAAELVVETSTVKSHLTRILPKIGARDRVQAVVWAFRNGLV